MSLQSDKKETSKEQLDLSSFFPYQLAVFSDDISKAIAQIYTDRFNLTRQEWRVFAALGNQKPHEAMSAKEIAEYSTLEKMQVSRAITRLLNAELIHREEDTTDRRHHRLSLSKKGLATYQEIIPLALAREEYILSAITPDEIDTFLQLMNKLQKRASKLKSWG